MLVEGHGLAVRVPQGWEAKIFRHPHGEPTLHAASFALPLRDGEFGAHATTGMGPGDAFCSVTEYLVDENLTPGVGLFAPAQPRGLEAGEFRLSALMADRPGQLGVQRFFTATGRPFCLYAVLGSAAARARLPELGAVLGSLRIAPRD